MLQVPISRRTQQWHAEGVWSAGVVQQGSSLLDWAETDTESDAERARVREQGQWRAQNIENAWHGEEVRDSESARTTKMRRQ